MVLNWSCAPGCGLQNSKWARTMFGPTQSPYSPPMAKWLLRGKRSCKVQMMDFRNCGRYELGHQRSGTMYLVENIDAVFGMLGRKVPATERHQVRRGDQSNRL